MPPAPGLFSTITGCPKERESFSAIALASASEGLPAEKPTRILIGLEGKSSAQANRGAIAAVNLARASRRRDSRTLERCGMQSPFLSMSGLLRSSRRELLHEVIATDLHQQVLGVPAFRAGEPVPGTGRQHARLPRAQEQLLLPSRAG